MIRCDGCSTSCTTAHDLVTLLMLELYNSVMGTPTGLSSCRGLFSEGSGWLARQITSWHLHHIADRIKWCGEIVSCQWAFQYKSMLLGIGEIPSNSAIRPGTCHRSETSRLRSCFSHSQSASRAEQYQCVSAEY